MSYIGNRPKINTIKYKPLSSDPTNPQEGEVFYSDGTSRSEGLWIYKNGNWVFSNSSGGQGNKNYLSEIVTSQSSVANTGNGNFELGSTIGWSLGVVGTLTNGIPTGTPTFGSGASGNLNISTVSSGQLSGSYSLSYTSSAATTQGDMLASDAFYIDSSDQAKVLTWKFYYKATTNPGNANWSGTSSNSFGVAIWDVDNSVWVANTGNFGMTQSSGVGICTGSFQTSTNATQYRLVVYNANATSGAVTVYFDDFFVGPQTSPIGAVITDWQSYTPTVTSFSGAPTNYTATGRWRRIGDSIAVEGAMTFSGASAVYSGLLVSLPTGLTVNQTKFPATLWQIVGTSSWFDNGISGYTTGGALFESSTPTTISLYTSAINTFSGTAPSVAARPGNTFPFTQGNGDIISWEFTVPIVGWSSNVQMSSDTDTRVVASRFKTAVARTVNNTAPTIIYEQVDYDTHGAYNPSTGIYTTPVSGIYRITVHRRDTSISQTAGFEITNALYVNGSNVAFIGDTRFAATSTASFSVGGSIEYSLKAGDTVSIGGYSDTPNTTMVSLPTFNYVTISRISGPAVIAASESVNLRYENLTGSTINTTLTNMPFTTKIWDTHGSFDGATGIFTAPVSGTYAFQIGYALNTTNYNTSQGFLFYAYLDNTTLVAHNIKNGTGANVNYATTLSFTYKMRAGQTIRAKGLSVGISTTLTSGNENFFCCSRIGN